MSIEKNIERIANALEALTGKFDHIGQAVDAPKPTVVPPAVATVTQPVGNPTPNTTTPAATVTPAPPVTAPAAPPAPPAATMTPEDLNKALVAEFQRLGSREPIDTVMRAAPFNAQSITDLSPDQYAPLIAAVQAVKVG